MKRGIFLFLLCAGIILPLRAGDDAKLWSPVQGGLQARLVITPPQVHEDKYGIAVEFRNVQQNSAGVGLGLKLHYYRGDLSFHLEDRAGHVVRISIPIEAAENGIVDGRHLSLPPRVRVEFLIGGGGAPLEPGKPGPGCRLNFGGIHDYVLPPERGPYKLSAKFTKAQFSEAAANGLDVSPDMEAAAQADPDSWHGTLELPFVTLPQN